MPSLRKWIGSMVLIAATCATAWATPSFNNSAPWNAVTTYQSIGLYWKPSGVNGGKATVRFREQGTSTWREGHELWWDSRNAEFRGSLVELKSGTVYEIQLKAGTGAWTDTSASCNTASAAECNVPATTSCSSANRTQCTRTWSEDYRIKEVRPVSARTTQLVITEGGNETDGYVVYEGVDGNNTITLTEGSGHCVVVDTDFVVVRNLVLQGCGMDGIRLHSNHFSPGRRAASDVIIEDNEIKGFGRVRPNTNPPLALDYEAAISCNNWHETSNGDDDVNGRSNRIVIQRNKIHSPRYSSNPWKRLYSDTRTHPEGAQAVTFGRCGSNHVVRWNDVYSENGNFFNDGFGGGENFGGDSGSGGFPWADSDIYGNRISHVYDDGIEAEGDNRNVRIWANYFDRVFVAIGNAATAKGPLYVWRNVTNAMANMYCTGCDSDTDDERGELIKGGGKSGSSYNGGIAYYYHNTLLQPPPAAGKTFPMGAGGGIAGVEVLYNFVSRNNIWHIHKITDNPGLPDFWSIHADCDVGSCSPPTPDNGPAADYDVFNGRILNAGTNAESNAVKLGWGALGGNASKVPTYLAGGSSYPSTIPSAQNDWTGDFRLAAGTLGTSNVPLLPNFNDLDGTRHVGAQPPNKTEMKFGRAASAASGSAPTAALAVSPSEGQAGITQFTFSASASSAGSAPISALRLEFGDGTADANWTDKDQNQTHTYQSAGSFTARLTVTDSTGRQSSDSKQVNVVSDPTGPTAVLSVTPSSGQAGVTVFTFSAAGSAQGTAGPISTLRLQFGDGTEVNWADKSQVQTHTYAAASPTPYTATLTVTDSTGRQGTDGRTVTVASGSAFELFVGASPGLVISRSGQQITFSVSTPNNTPALQQVTFAIDGVLKATRTAAPFNYTWVPDTSDQAGSHTLVVTATSTQGAVATETRALTLLAANCAIFASGSSAVQGESLSFQGICSDAQALDRIEFFVNNVLQSPNRDASVPYTWIMDTSAFAVGTHTVRVRGMLDETSVGEASVPVQITAAPLAVTFSPGATVHRTEDLNVTVSATDGRTLRQVDFYINGQFVLGQNVAPFQLVSTGSGSSARPDRFGRHALVVQATDAQGNVLTARRDFYVLTEMCNLLLATSKYLVSSHDTVRVGAHTVIQGETLMVEGLCSSSQALTRVDFYLDGVHQVGDGTAPWGWAIDTSPFGPGDHTVSMRAVFADGTTWSQSLPIRIVAPRP